MRLTQRQEEILIGLILGDGCLEKNGNNVRLRVEHCLQQKEYLEWLYRQFRNIIPKKPRMILSKDSRNNKVYKKLHFSTFSLECLNNYYSTFYKERKKIIPKNIKEILKSKLSLAVWFMDDGYKRNDCCALRISTDSFNYEDQADLIDCLRKNFDINCKLHKKLNAWNIYIPKKIAESFCSLVKPFIIPSMKYKINLTP